MRLSSRRTCASRYEHGTLMMPPSDVFHICFALLEKHNERTLQCAARTYEKWALISNSSTSLRDIINSIAARWPGRSRWLSSCRQSFTVYENYVINSFIEKKNYIQNSCQYQIGKRFISWRRVLQVTSQPKGSFKISFAARRCTFFQLALVSQWTVVTILGLHSRDGTGR